MIDEQTLGLFAFDAETGIELWRKTWPTPELMEVHKTNSHASTTPAADADRVYFYFKTLGMLALDAKTGELLWQQELPKPFFVFKWGAGMSPVLYKDKVIFCQDDDLYPALYAFDKETGELIWKDDRSDMAVNYSHPVICKTEAGRRTDRCRNRKTDRLRSGDWGTSVARQNIVAKHQDDARLCRRHDLHFLPERWNR